ncbi:TetR/AcrR family transcriptional regulator [Roseomonas sp. HJA6]|uniref:TetR/AcrR family transcriptional regulator n=1 Tax=Roseomonas alba TaxID=2846776 RepID=A0ABS7AGN6_9PROT|nr:TetR/AcrR family transcriptional regulator [Neoroseomonas alba]MBW6401333.1 TetR/AcrR family transcriptional regulator [Neoroseomonas alba]
MGRGPAIDRERVLGLAEDILLRDGPRGLTIEALAKAAGVSKGGIQSSFGTKNDLIAALMDRWQAEYDAQVVPLVGASPGPVEAVRGHVRATIDLTDDVYTRAAGMMAALIETEQHVAALRDWYRGRFGGLDLTTPEGRRARLALLAAEGAYMYRAFGLMTFTPEEWQSLGQDLDALLAGEL